MRILVRDGWLITCDDRRTELPRGHLVIENGKIRDIFAGNLEGDLGRFDRVIDAAGKVVLPGLINGHTHAYANLVKATLENLRLEPWMLYIANEGRSMGPEDVYYNTLLGCVEMLKTGTTACVDHLAQGKEGLEAALKAYADAGMRAAVAPMISDRAYYQTLPLSEEEVPPEMRQPAPATAGELVRMTEELFKEWHGRYGRLQVMFGPSGPQRCSDELLRECARLAAMYGTGWHSHVLETRVQKVTAQKFYGGSMIRHLDRLGCLSSRTSLVHGVWLDEEEIELVARRQALVVHNPASNLTLGSGIAPLSLYRKYGVRVALGTDGANCGGNLNMLESMKLAALLPRVVVPDQAEWPTAADVLFMATRNGAAVLQEEARLGSLEPGKEADLVIFDPNRSPALLPLQNPVRQLVYGETGQGVETVLVAGRVVVDQGRVTTIDEEHLRNEVEVRAARIVERASRQRPALDRQADFLNKTLFGR